MKVIMKPETIARRAAERAAKRRAAKVERIARLSAKAEEHGPESIWAEMLAIEMEGAT